jgi:NADH-quinone oxidoreductase subunit J
MVMFLFVIAYLGGKADAPWTGQLSVQTTAAVVAAGALLVEIVLVIAGQADGHLSHAAEISSAFGSPAEIGRLFLTDQLLAFEITSVILLVAAVGGVILGSLARWRRRCSALTPSRTWLSSRSCSRPARSAC